MEILNIAMKFNNFEMFEHFCDNFDLSSAHACRVLNVKYYNSGGHNQIKVGEK